MASNEFLKNVTGPQLEKDGVKKDRYPILKIGNGISVTDEPTYPRHTLTVDADKLTNVTQFTGSVNNQSIYNVATPRFAKTGTISSGSQIAIACTIKNNSYADYTAKAIVRNGDTVHYVGSFNILALKLSGSAQQVYKQDTDSLANSNFTLSSSIKSDAVYVYLNSTSGSAYSYIFTCDGTEATV